MIKYFKFILFVKFILFMAHMFESFSMRADLSAFKVGVFYDKKLYSCDYIFNIDKSSISVDELLVFFRENINGFVNPSSSKKFNASLLNDKICSFSTCVVYDNTIIHNKIQEIKVLSSDKTIKNLCGVGYVEINLVLKDDSKTKETIQKEEKCCCR